MIFRILKRRTSLEFDDPDLLLDIEFRDRTDNTPDLKPSVYLVTDDSEALRAYCEHVASFISPPRGGHGLDVDGLDGFVVHEDPGQTMFAFANEQHRELLFEDEEALRSFLATLIGGLSERAVQFTKAQVHDYVRTHADDPEWKVALETAPKASKWKKAVGLNGT